MTQLDSRPSLAASFRDPSGFLFRKDDILYRQVNQVYQADYETLINSGLYEKLTQTGLLIAHEEVSFPEAPPEAFKFLKPELVPVISYPYEWCFSQLREAALTTLKIQKTALDYGLSLKDASAYNIQFLRGQSVLIDSLSFERLKPDTPWIAYRQFCQHFLAPLTLCAYTDERLLRLLRIYIDGLPLDLTSRLLPSRTRMSLALQIHIHAHARSQVKYADRPIDKSKLAPKFSKNSILALIDSLQTLIEKLQWRPPQTEWGDYYSATNYTSQAQIEKKVAVTRFLTQAKPRSVWDLGANTGLFSRIASEQGINTVAFDIDPVAVEKNFRYSSEKQDRFMLPLLLDLTNPSPGIGWHNTERDALLQRGPADLVMALALVHHLAISNNLPLVRIAEFMAEAGNWLIIEFVPKTDSQVQRLLATREDIFTDYHSEGFERAFSEQFEIISKESIAQSDRTIYLMRKV